MSRSIADKRGVFGRSVVASSVLLAVTASVLAPAELQAQPRGAVGAGSASAAPKPVSDDKKKEAGERFKRGVKLQEEGSLDAAVIEFERAYELSPATYQVLYNIAVVYRDKGDRASALRAFERFLAEGKEGVDAKRRKDVEGEIAKLREVVATLTIKTPVAGADISVDDLPVGKTPLAQPLMVNVGRHKIEASKEGYRGDIQFVTLAGRDNRTIEVNLREIKVDAPPPATTTAPVATTAAPLASAPPANTARVSTEGTGYRGLGIGLGIAGLVGIGVGTGFGLAARGNWNDVKDTTCRDNRCTTQAAQDKAEKAKSQATVSTLGFGLGGVALLAGVILIATSSSGSDEKASGEGRWKITPAVGQRTGGVLLGGAF